MKLKQQDIRDWLERAHKTLSDDKEMVKKLFDVTTERYIIDPIYKECKGNDEIGVMKISS